MKNPLLSATLAGDGVPCGATGTGALGRDAGRVVGVFSTGYYVQAGDRIFAVGGPRLPAGPIHLVLEAAPPSPPEGSLVRLGSELLSTATHAVGLASAARYRPYRPAPAQLRALAPLLACLHDPDDVADDLVHLWPDVTLAARRRDLHRARRLLQGVGSGLTPTGDDVLAALLLFSHWVDPSSTLPAEVAAETASTDLSRSFLRWAAAGQSIEPVHALLVAAQGDAALAAARDRWLRAVKDVAAIGATSGKALLTGLGLAAGAWLCDRGD